MGSAFTRASGRAILQAVAQLLSFTGGASSIFQQKPALVAVPPTQTLPFPQCSSVLCQDTQM